MLKNKKSNRSIPIVIIVLLVVIIIGIGIYVLSNREIVNDSKNDTNKTENGNNKQLDQKEDKNIKLPTDMNAVSKSINDNLGTFLTFRLDRTMSSSTQLTLDMPGENLLNNFSKRIDLVNSLLMNDNCNWTNTNKNYQDFPYVSLETYKEKYQEVYGSLDNFEDDKNNSSLFMANTIDADMSSDLIGWNGAWGVVSTAIEVRANTVTYDDATEQFIISGKIDFISEETNATIQTNDISINYVNNGEVKYLVSIIVK